MCKTMSIKIPIPFAKPHQLVLYITYYRLHYEKR